MTRKNEMSQDTVADYIPVFETIARTPLVEDAQHAFESAQDRVNQYFNKILVRKPANTQKAYKHDINYFSAWAQNTGSLGLTHDLAHNKHVIEDYIEFLCSPLNGFSRATVERRIAVLSTFLAIAEWPNPLKESKLTREHYNTVLNTMDGQQKQASALSFDLLTNLNDTFIPQDWLGLRARLVLNLMFDGLLRASEVCNIKLSDINRNHNSIRLSRSKTDRAGRGTYRFVSDTTLSMLDEWLSETKISDGYVIRALSPKQTLLDKPASYQIIRSATKLISSELGFIGEENLTTHSARVGAAICMVESGEDILSIMHAGGWKSTEMVVRYTKEVAAGKHGMANVAKLRDR